MKDDKQPNKKRYFSITAVIVLVLAVILLSSILISPYKEIDIENAVYPNVGEKVQFNGIYFGITSWGDEDVLYYMPPTNYDVIEFDGEYIFLSGDYRSHNLFGNEGKTVHLEGEFEDGSPTMQPFENRTISGYFFNADKIELI